MKKICLILFLILPLIVTGCAPSQDEMQTLKIKVVNLETTLNTQNQKYEEIEKKLNELDKKLIDLENKISKDVVVEMKTQVFSELEKIKKEQDTFSSQLEELKFSQEAEKKEINSQLEHLSTKTQELELKIKEIEKKLTTPSMEVSNETALTSNATLSISENISNATQIATITTKKPEEKPLSEVQLYEKAYSYYRNRDFKNARRLFEEYIKKFPKGKWIGQAYFWIGESYFQEKNYEEAILNYQKLIDLPGWHPLKPTAMFNQAKAFKSLGDTEAYRLLLKKIITQYPNSKEAEMAKKLLK